jgi:hypothetical protein
MPASAWKSDSYRSAVVNTYAIIADAERVQPVALGVRSCRSVDTRAPQVVRSSPSDDAERRRLSSSPP